MGSRNVAKGLADVVAVATSLSRVDGSAGQLVVRGYPMEELAKRKTFSEVAELLWEQSDDVEARLADLRSRLFSEFSETRAVRLADPMDAIRAGVASLESSGNHYEDALVVTAAVPVIAALWWRLEQREKLSWPDIDRGHAVDVLSTITGRRDLKPARALEKYLITVSDHGMNASTFTARVIASTRSDLVSAVVGAIGALKGPLHGGAPGPVLDMLDAVAADGDPERWLRSELEQGRRIMGMGHRVYRVRDPRAAVFEEALAELSADGAAGARLGLAREVERAATRLLGERYPDRQLKANVEFYTAVLLEAVGIPRALFTPVFAAGRVLGWCAHVMEQAAEDHLIRPRSVYVGPMPAARG